MLGDPATADNRAGLFGDPATPEHRGMVLVDPLGADHRPGLLGDPATPEHRGMVLVDPPRTDHRAGVLGDPAAAGVEKRQARWGCQRTWRVEPRFVRTNYWSWVGRCRPMVPVASNRTTPTTASHSQGQAAHNAACAAAMMNRTRTTKTSTG